MGKYIDAEKLKKFEEALADVIASSQGLCTYEACKDVAKRESPILIDSLQQEQPIVDLDSEIEKELRLHYNDDQDVYWWNYLKNSFRHFYELGKNSK